MFNNRQRKSVFRYFDQVVGKVDLSRIRRIAENVCGALGLKLSDKWETYASDLPKYPITTIYLTSLELKSAGDVVHLEGVKTRILNVIYYRVNGQYCHYFHYAYAREDEINNHIRF